jgi:hypothetical protein
VPAVLDIIRSIPRREGRDLLFGLNNNSGFQAWDRSKKRLDTKLTVNKPWNIHDIRRSIATRLADLGTPPHIIEVLLNHYSGFRGGPAGTYNRSTYQIEVKQTLALWADHVNALVIGGERKVISLHA